MTSSQSQLQRRQTTASPSINDELSKQFREHMAEIQQTFRSLTGCTQDLEDKVDRLLRRQEEQFFSAYKVHFATLREEVRKKEAELKEQQRKIDEYENVGALSTMIKRTASLQKQLIEVYRKLEQKEKEIRNEKLKLTISTHQQEKLQRKIKEITKQNRLASITFHESTNPEIYGNTVPSKIHNETQSLIFATEIEQKATRPTKEATHIGSQHKLIGLKSFASQRQLPENRHSELIRKRLQTQLSHLRKKYNELLKNNVRTVSLHNQMSLFFINCVETIKKDVCHRSQASFCTLQDFKKQDKIKVLLLLLQNDEAISYVHEKIFGGEGQNNQPVFEKLKNRSLFEQTTGRSRQPRSSVRQIQGLQEAHRSQDQSRVHLPYIRKKAPRSPKIILKQGNINFAPY